jgi:predicted nucleic acid-binding protein
VTAGFLVDKSALARWDQPAVGAALEPALTAGLLWTCPPVELEVLFSCRNAQEYLTVRQERALAYRHGRLASEVGVVAGELQEALARDGSLRSAGPVDLMIGAVAILEDLVVLHYDADFETLARADERLQQQWVAPRGALA